METKVLILIILEVLYEDVTRLLLDRPDCLNPYYTGSTL